MTLTLTNPAQHAPETLTIPTTVTETNEWHRVTDVAHEVTEQFTVIRLTWITSSYRYPSSTRDKTLCWVVHIGGSCQMFGLWGTQGNFIRALRGSTRRNDQLIWKTAFLWRVRYRRFPLLVVLIRITSENRRRSSASKSASKWLVLSDIYFILPVPRHMMQWSYDPSPYVRWCTPRGHEHRTYKNNYNYSVKSRHTRILNQLGATFSNL